MKTFYGVDCQTCGDTGIATEPRDEETLMEVRCYHCNRRPKLPPNFKNMNHYPLFTRPTKSNLEEAAAQLGDLTERTYELSWVNSKLVLFREGIAVSPPFTKKEMAAFLLASLTCLQSDKG
jgi:hypothetical protein